MTARDPFLSSTLSRSAALRMAGVALVLAGLWLAIAWAVSLP